MTTTSTHQELETLCQQMLDAGKAQLGARWSNEHPTYREIYAAFRAEDLEEAKRIFQANYS